MMNSVSPIYYWVSQELMAMVVSCIPHCLPFLVWNDLSSNRSSTGHPRRQIEICQQ